MTVDITNSTRVSFSLHILVVGNIMLVHYVSNYFKKPFHLILLINVYTFHSFSWTLCIDSLSISLSHSRHNKLCQSALTCVGSDTRRVFNATTSHPKQYKHSMIALGIPEWLVQATNRRARNGIVQQTRPQLSPTQKPGYGKRKKEISNK